MTERADTLTVFEAAIDELLTAFDVERAPVPVELMLQRPRPGMWREVNLTDLSLSFINVSERFSPRMSVARLLARHISRGEWGAARGLAPYAESEEDIRMLARAIVMPRAFLDALHSEGLDVVTISERLEVPEEDVLQRLEELGRAG
jgi:hypothetical protein